METITINKVSNLQRTNFINLDDLLDYLLSIYNSKIEYEDFSSEEISQINSLPSANKFKNAVKNLKI